jgi:hypothetical protein
MDGNKLIARVRALLITPKFEWPIIAREPETPASLYKNYVLILAAIPALAGFLRGSFIGYADQYLGTSRIEMSAALSGIIVEYALTLGSVYVLALIVDAVAALFGAQKNGMQALKLSAYSHTASWVASAGILLPGALSFLVVLAGSLYGVYLMYVGLPHMMKSSVQRSAGYAAVVIVAAIFLNLIVATTVRSVTHNYPSHRVVVGASLRNAPVLEERKRFAALLKRTADRDHSMLPQRLLDNLTHD